MRNAWLFLFTVYLALVAFLLVWATWLLASDDPDGGRHPVGAVMLLTAVVLGIAGAVLARRWRRG